ncbi:MAG: carbohydrate kinase family protein [Nitrospiraceae bacterium]|nr:carbohydrate kinase family protein [Nitrospiraceae bacterium]
MSNDATNREYDAMLAGALCLDVIPRFPDTGATQIAEIMRPGKVVNMEEAQISTGGPVSNTGLNMKTLGNKVCFCARTGDDEFGVLTIRRLQASGNADGVHVVKGADSSYTIVVAPPGIDRIFLHCPGTNNGFVPDDLDPTLIARCRHFHFGYPPLMRHIYENEGEDLREVFRIAKDAGATTSCDMTLPDPDSASGAVNWRGVLAKTLPYVDLFLPSIEESFYMLEPQAFLEMKREHAGAELIDFFTPAQYSWVADEMLAMGCKIVSLKSGHRGFYLKTASGDTFDGMGAAQPGDAGNWSSRELWAPAYQAPQFGSATGSGDSAIAGLLSAFLRGRSIEESLLYAVCCGLQNVQVLDAVSGIRPWDETTATIAERLPTIDAHIDADGWRWHEEAGLWAGSSDPLNAP